MNEKLTQFIAKVHAGDYNVNHRPDEVEVEDPTAFDQCFDLLLAYCDFLGIPRETVRHQYAYQIWLNQTDLLKKYFDVFPNTATFIPNTGDVALYDQRVGSAGHVDLVGKGSDINNLISYSQNWDTLHYYHIDSQGNHIPYCRTIVHANYYGCVGFLRPKVALKNWDVVRDRMLAALNGGGTSENRCREADKIFNL